MVLLRALLAGRWLIGAMVLPYAMLIARGAASGGWVGVVGLLATMLYALACLDSLVLELERRLCLQVVPSRQPPDSESVAIARFVLGTIASLFALAALFVQVWIGLTLFAALVLIRIGVGSRDGGRLAWLLRWVEFSLPIAILVVPLLLARGYAAQAVRDAVNRAYDQEIASQAAAMMQTGLGTSEALGVLLGAAMFSAVLLLCMLRDEVADRGAGIGTTPVVLGRRGATLLLTLVGLIAGGLSMAGAAICGWSWGVPAVVFALAQLALWAMLTRAERIAAPVWLLGALLLGVVVLAS